MLGRPRSSRSYAFSGAARLGRGFVLYPSIAEPLGTSLIGTEVQSDTRYLQAKAIISVVVQFGISCTGKR